MLKTILIILLIVLSYLLFIKPSNPIRETFTDNNDKFIHKQKGLYDEFYTEIYDDLVYNQSKNEFEIEYVVKHVNGGEALDIGSGTGYHVDQLNQQGFNCIGIDSSKAMVAKATEKFPNHSFLNKDVTQTISFQPNSFDLITCFYFTAYYIEHKKQFFENISLWLKPGGVFVIHLVDKHKFNPIVPAGDPFVIISPQNYADKRINESIVHFENFKYKSNFSLPQKNKGVFKEYFKFKNSNKVRQNDHIFFMENQSVIIQLIKNVGFVLEESVDMSKCAYDNQFLYIFKKPDY